MKLIPIEVFRETNELVSRYEMLQSFAQQLHSRQGGKYSVILGDITKGGRSLQPGGEIPLQGTQADGIPASLARCRKRRELRGQCINPKTALVVQVHCKCENDNLCAACLTHLYERKLNSTCLLRI